MLSTQEMQKMMESIVYRPGWKIEVYETPFQGPCLAVSARVDNSYDPLGPMVDLRIKTLLPPFDGMEDFLRFLRWRLAQIAVHESDEWLRWDASGRPVFDPHEESATEPA